MMVPLVMLPGSAFGHGKEITLMVSTISAATDPMSKDFTVKATYADGDPVDAAKIEHIGHGSGRSNCRTRTIRLQGKRGLHRAGAPEGAGRLEDAGESGERGYVQSGFLRNRPRAARYADAATFG